MDGVPLASTALRLMVAITFALQLGLLVKMPIPSPVSSRRMRPRFFTSPADDPGADPVSDSLMARLLPLGALTGLLPILPALVLPGIGAYLLPAGTSFPGGLSAASAVCLLAGNGLVAAAVFSLRRQTVFDATGQSLKLITGGVFGFAQHPIVSGLGLIYFGLFLALPSPLVMGGLICFGWHQQRRLAAEEVLLENRFGPCYRRYRHRVGRFWPRWPGRQ